MNDQEVNALRVEADQAHEITKCLLGDLRHANGLLLINEVKELRKTVASLGARVGTLEERDAKREKTLNDAREAFRKLERKVQAAPLQPQASQAT